MTKILPISANINYKNIKKVINKNKQKACLIDLAYEDKGYYKIGDRFVKQIFTRYSYFIFYKNDDNILLMQYE